MIELKFMINGIEEYRTFSKILEELADKEDQLVKKRMEEQEKMMEQMQEQGDPLGNLGLAQKFEA